MEAIIDFLYQVKEFLNPKVIIDTLLNWLGVYVYFGLIFIIFAETGLAIGFFLPGDSLLVVAGLFAAAGKLNIWIMLVTLFIAAVVGDAVGYYSGRKIGPAIFSRPKSRFFNPEHLKKAHAFYEKHGGKTIIIARFVPIVRTFAPIVAGAAKMTYRDFFVFNVVGGFFWVTSMLLAGYYLGGVVEIIVQNWFGVANFKLEDHIDKVVIVVVFLSILPMIYEYTKTKFGKKEPDAEVQA
ncbi:MAG: VTT domain-containing protein [Pyrinomonadaceae bacterium]|nr:VTT domain-containing protein [Pyrinomonadaceae bacterium]